MKALFTIITVCRNAEDTIEKTIQSVLSQNDIEIEYIIIDGASTDSTVELIDQYTSRYSIKLISEPDQGLYDAMNKGAKLASGDYIHFLNAGDVYSTPETLLNVSRKLESHLPDLAYGHIRYVHPDGTTEVRNYGTKCGTSLYFLTGDCINHQAVFAKRSLFQYNLFDIQYRICADREWMMRLKRERHVAFTAINVLVCDYSLDEDSMSIKNKELYESEAEKCIRKYFPMSHIVFDFFQYCRHNTKLKKLLHVVYRLLYIRK